MARHGMPGRVFKNMPEWFINWLKYIRVLRPALCGEVRISRVLTKKRALRRARHQGPTKTHVSKHIPTAPAELHKKGSVHTSLH